MTHTSDITVVLDGILAGITAANATAAGAVAENSAVKAAREAARQGDLSRFYFTLQYPLQQLIDGIVSLELPTAPEARFLFTHYDFVEHHITGHICTHEGRSCSSDKSRAVLRGLLRYLTTGMQVSFDYTQQYTFHLPTTVLTTHDAILMFYKALQSLYYGDPEAYLLFLAQRRDGSGEAPRDRTDPVNAAPL